jgi:hypothetical protein
MARPKFKATHEQRKNVEAMAAYGIDEGKIACIIGDRGIDPKTLRKHFRHELDVGATKANAVVGQTGYQMATSGRHPAVTIFWMKCRMHWKETNVLQHTGPDGGPIEISNDQLNDQLDERITGELARIAAARAVASVPEPVDDTTEDPADVPLEELKSKT